MVSLSNMSDVLILGGIDNNSSKTVLNTLQLVQIKSRETPKQEITIVESTTNQSICSHGSSITCEILSEMFEIPVFSRRRLTGILNTV